MTDIRLSLNFLWSLKNEFYERVQARGATPDVEVRPREAIAELKKTIANKHKKLAQIREDVPALARAVHQLTLENQELRNRLQVRSEEPEPRRHGIPAARCRARAAGRGP